MILFFINVDNGTWNVLLQKFIKWAMNDLLPSNTKTFATGAIPTNTI